jgi:SPP1 family predicted phage head-tail adaptor
MTFDSGKLNKRVTIQKPSTLKDGYGQPIIDAWEDVKTVWANVSPIVGREYFAAETVNSEVSHKVRMRYRPNVKAEMRIKYGNRILSILTVIDYKEMHVELQLMCKELI